MLVSHYKAVIAAKFCISMINIPNVFISLGMQAIQITSCYEMDYGVYFDEASVPVKRKYLLHCGSA